MTFNEIPGVNMINRQSKPPEIQTDPIILIGKRHKGLGALAVLLLSILIFAAYFAINSPSGPVVQSMMQDTEDQVASDAVTQYNITARSGSATDRCVQAGIVTAGYLQAKNETKYSSWKAVQRRDCKAAGFPDGAF